MYLQVGRSCEAGDNSWEAVEPAAWVTALGNRGSFRESSLMVSYMESCYTCGCFLITTNVNVMVQINKIK